MTESPTQKPPSAPIFEPTADEFSSHAKTPHLSGDANARTKSRPLMSPLAEELSQNLKLATDQESLYDTFRIFKKQQIQRIQKLESSPLQNRRAIMRQLSEVADAVIICAYQTLLKDMQRDWGQATYLSSYKQLLPSHLAIVGMGKCGSQEMNYESDLDLIFIYSHIGETTGKRIATNGEYFSRFSQKFLNLLSVPTTRGRCYDTDVELRPSGNSGTLVSSLESFLDHQMNRSQEWERLALLRSRAIVTHEDFLTLLSTHLDKLSFERHLMPDFFTNMATIRKRVIAERSKEAPDRIDLKLGPGGLMDIEFTLQGQQLKALPIYQDLRQRGIFELIEHLKLHNLFPESELTELADAYTLFRTIESKLHLLRNRSEAVIHVDSDDFLEIAKQLGFADKQDLKRNIDERRHAVRESFERLYHATQTN